MKKILITGVSSYVGTSLEKWLAKYPDKYYTETVDMRVDSWRKRDFSKFDVIFHVAGIAHIKETKENYDLYYKINRDLAYGTAKKAKAEGVRQFIFLSSMSVYGVENGVIDINTPLNPKSNYGKSKLQAEELIQALCDDAFKVAIIRPPIIYGNGCKGNYPRLAKFARDTPIFPNINNSRSMIYIDNLCEFVRLLIDDCNSGLFFPQNAEYVCTSDMVRQIAEIHGNNVKMTKIFNPILRLFKSSIVKKLFGDLVYDFKLSNYRNFEYCICDFEKSIYMSETK